jgi:hypothetical protein
VGSNADGGVKKKMSILQNLPNIIEAIGLLGIAACGLVDATKSFAGGVNSIGFMRIEAVVKSLTPGTGANGLTQDKIVDTLRANWYSGQELTSQKAIAKSLIKMGLNAGNAAALSKATGVDAGLLKIVAEKTSSGAALLPNESDANARFDFILTALLDELYQHADQAYTNGTRILAFVFSLMLAIFGGWSLKGGPLSGYLRSNDLGLAIIVGLVATPLAPVAKDISKAVSAVVKKKIQSYL